MCKFLVSLVFTMLLYIQPISASKIHSQLNSPTFIKDTTHCSAFSDTTSVQYGEMKSVLKKSPLTDNQKKKLIAAMMAFPFPFGFMGAHRIMLGTKPWVPVVYVATFGGCFGLIPLIDFCVITFGKDIEQYENNPSVFMWVK